MKRFVPLLCLILFFLASCSHPNDALFEKALNFRPDIDQRKVTDDVVIDASNGTVVYTSTLDFATSGGATRADTKITVSSDFFDTVEVAGRIYWYSALEVSGPKSYSASITLAGDIRKVEEPNAARGASLYHLPRTYFGDITLEEGDIFSTRRAVEGEVAFPDMGERDPNTADYYTALMLFLEEIPADIDVVIEDEHLRTITIYYDAQIDGFHFSGQRVIEYSGGEEEVVIPQEILLAPVYEEEERRFGLV